MKKILLFLICFAFIVSGTVFAGGQKEDQLTIGQILMDASHPYQQAFSKWTEKICEEKGIKYIGLDSETNAMVQTNLIEDLISRQVDGMIIQPIDPKGVVTLLDEAKDTMAVVGWGTKPDPNKQPFVIMDEHEIAKAMGALAAKKWKEFYPDQPIKVGTINIPGLFHVDQHRVHAFVSGVESVDPNAEWVIDLNGEGLRDVSYAAGEDMLQSNPEVNIVYGSNADMALGCLAAFEAAGRGKAVDGVPVTEIFAGTDGSEAEMLKIADPTSSFKITMALTPKDHAIASVDTVLGIINGEIDKNNGDKVVKVEDWFVNGWEIEISEIQAFIEEQYFSEIDIKEELGL